MKENTETDQGIFIPNEDAATETPGLPTPLPNNYTCDKCDRAFKSIPALRMHNVRAHSKGWDTSGNFGRGGKKAMTEEQRLAHRREYQKKLRKRYRLQGKDSRGYPLKTGKGKGGNKRLSWTPERRAQFKRTWKKKLLQSAAKATNKRIQIVYPNPLDEAPLDLGTVTIPSLKFCPNCGEHLEGWRRS